MKKSEALRVLESQKQIYVEQAVMVGSAGHQAVAVDLQIMARMISRAIETVKQITEVDDE